VPKHAQTSPPCWRCMNQGKMRKVSTYIFSNIQNSSQEATQVQMSKLDTLQVRNDLIYMITKFHNHWTRLKRIWVHLRKVTLSWAKHVKMAKPHKLHDWTTILIIRPSQTPTSTSCHVKTTEPCAYFYVWDFSLVGIMQRFSTQSKLIWAHMTWEHIFQAFAFHFQIYNWYMKCLCDKKELMPFHKIKQEG
jgi:hypothetical protein